MNAYKLHKSLCLFLHVFVKRVFPKKKLKEDFHPLWPRNALEPPNVFPRSVEGKHNHLIPFNSNKPNELISINFPRNSAESNGKKGQENIKLIKLPFWKWNARL